MQPKRRHVLSSCSQMRQKMLAPVCTVQFIMRQQQSQLPPDTTARRINTAGAPTPGTTQHRSFHHLLLTEFISVFSSRLLSGLPTERFPTDYHATSVSAFLHSATHPHCPTLTMQGGLRKSRIPTSPSRISREAVTGFLRLLLLLLRHTHTLTIFPHFRGSFHNYTKPQRNDQQVPVLNEHKATSTMAHDSHLLSRVLRHG